MQKPTLLLMTMVRLCVGSTLQHQFDIFEFIYLKLNSNNMSIFFLDMNGESKREQLLIPESVALQ